MSRQNEIIHVLLLEDDNYLATKAADFLRENGMTVVTSFSVKEFWQAYRKDAFDVLILDILLGDGNGLDICRKIRTESNVPIIFTTSLDEVADTVLGLEMGGDAYLAKPYSLREILLRIHSILYRIHECAPEQATLSGNVRLGGFRLDASQRLLLTDNEAILLSNAEYRLLKVFMDNPCVVLSREYLLSCFGHQNTDSFEHRLDTQIYNLRKKLRNISIIRTIRGLGYLFDPPKEKNGE